MQVFLVQVIPGKGKEKEENTVWWYIVAIDQMQIHWRNKIIHQCQFILPGDLHWVPGMSNAFWKMLSESQCVKISSEGILGDTFLM